MNEIDFINKWSPNGFKYPYPNFCFKLDLKELKEQIRAEVIEEVKEKLNNSGAEITFNLPVEEILGEDIDLDDFAMLVQDAVQVYRKMVLGVLEQLKEQK